MAKLRRAERGQTMVILLFVMVGLLAMIGLVVDGSIVFLERRRMQNASDAAALAGTLRLSQAICSQADAGSSDASVLAGIVDFAQRNGVQNSSGVSAEYMRFSGTDIVPFSPAVMVGGGAVPNGAAGIAVTSVISRPTYFLRIVDQDVGTAQASATGVTGAPVMSPVGGGLRPIGIPLDVVEAMPHLYGGGDGDGDDECMVLEFGNCDPEDPENDPCKVTDLDGDPVASHHGLFNFECAWNTWPQVGDEAAGWPRAYDCNGSDNKLKEWMENGWQGHTFWADCEWPGCQSGDFVHAKPGAPPNVIKETPEEELFFVPIYDAFPRCSTQVPDPKPSCPTQAQGYMYHVVGFAGVTVPAGGANQGAKTIKMCLEQTIMGTSSPSPNDGYGSSPSETCATHSMVVVLME